MHKEFLLMPSQKKATKFVMINLKTDWMFQRLKKKTQANRWQKSGETSFVLQDVHGNR